MTYPDHWSVLLVGDDKEFRSHIFTSKDAAQAWVDEQPDDDGYHSAIFIQELPN